MYPYSMIFQLSFYCDSTYNLTYNWDLCCFSAQTKNLIFIADDEVFL